MTLIMVPINYNTGSDTSYYEICLETEELRDIRDRIMLGENANEYDVKRISDCIDGEARRHNTIKTVALWVLGVLLVLLITLVIVLGITGY